jgi:hypothetical protein
MWDGSAAVCTPLDCVLPLGVSEGLLLRYSCHGFSTARKLSEVVVCDIGCLGILSRLVYMTIHIRWQEIRPATSCSRFV